MKNILLKKILSDCIIFFLTTLIITSLVIWVIQSVNYLDIIVEDGRDFLVYLNFSLFNFPKIISKILPFVFFFSFFYIFSKYESDNEMIILWTHGVHKKLLFNFYLKFSILIVIFQIILNTLIVPNSLNYAKSFIRNSEINFINNFVKPLKFNDVTKGLTFYAEEKNQDGTYGGLYIKQGNNLDNSKIIYAKKGIAIKKNDLTVMELHEGETINIIKDKVSSFKFDKFDLYLDDFKSNTVTHVKTQELTTLKLMKCFLKMNNLSFFNIDLKNYEIENCVKNNFNNITKELNKRIIQPFYLSILTCIFLLLLLNSKENKNYKKNQLFIFIFGILVIIISEFILRLVNGSIFGIIISTYLPFIILAFFLIFIRIKFNFKIKI